MFASRRFRSVVALSVCMSATVALAGCYDLSAPDGPRREDFRNDPSASAQNTDSQQQAEPARANRSEEAARAATKAVTASESTTATGRSARDGALLPTPAGAEMSVAEYIARYIQPAAPSPP